MDDTITLTVPSPFADKTISITFENWERKELFFRKGSPLAYGVMGTVCSSYLCQCNFLVMYYDCSYPLIVNRAIIIINTTALYNLYFHMFGIVYLSIVPG